MYLKILVGCLFLLGLFGCKKDNQTNVIVNIEDDFYIDLFEDIGDGEQIFQLDISTISEQSCLNYQIDHDLSVDTQTYKIELVINDLLEPNDCIEGMSPTNLALPFGQLPMGSYSFSINLKDAVFNKGRLSVLEDQYLLQLNSDYGIEMLHNLLYRIPQNTLWGYVAYDSSTSNAEADGFVADLEALSVIENVESNTLYQSGYYGYFNVDEDKKVALTKEISSSYHKPFLFHNVSDDLTEVEGLIISACGNGNLDIHLFTEKGQEIKCE